MSPDAEHEIKKAFQTLKEEISGLRKEVEDLKEEVDYLKYNPILIWNGQN